MTPGIALRRLGLLGQIVQQGHLDFVPFDDYFNRQAGVGAQAAVDELLASGSVQPVIQRAHSLVWMMRR